MSTELNQVVKAMSKVSVPQEILSKVDMKSLLKDFSDDYIKLDNLKEVRARHADRNFLSRWWNNEELKDAQLDAAELQASFSKKLGQLMVISVAQSQQLHQQQNDLSDQQQIIKKQTEQLAENDENLKNQQLSLEEQNKKLEQLVNDYFELKGLTQDGALKLIKIANEVKETKDSLMTSFESRMEEIEGVRQNIFTEQSELISSQTQQLNSFKNDVEHLMDAHQQKNEQLIKQTLQQITQTSEQFQQAFKMTEQRVVEDLSKSLEQQKQLQTEYEHRWQADKMQVLDRLVQHQQDWMQEVQGLNSRLDASQNDTRQLEQQIGEQELQHLQKIELLHHLFNSQKIESEQRDNNWEQRWKVMMRTVIGVLIAVGAASGFMAYKAYFQTSLF